MLKLLNDNEVALAANEFEKWDKAGGQVVAGLLRRRVAEKAEFLGQ
jgi:lysozyme